jgi:hypothetical protein
LVVLAAARSVRMRASSLSAGSSVGSWSTSLPSNADLRIACRNSEHCRTLESSVEDWVVAVLLRLVDIT